MPRFYSRYGMDGRDEDPQLPEEKIPFVKRPLYEENQSLLGPLRQNILKTTQPNHGPLMVRTVQDIQVGQEYEAVYFIPLRVRVTSAPYLKNGVAHIDVVYTISGYRDCLSLAEYAVVPYADGSWTITNYHLRKVLGQDQRITPSVEEGSTLGFFRPLPLVSRDEEERIIRDFHLELEKIPRLHKLEIETQSLFGNQANHGPLMVRTPDEIHVDEEYDSVRFSIHMRIRVKRVPYLRDGVLHIDAHYVGYGTTVRPLSLADYGVVPRADGSWETFAHLLRVPKTSEVTERKELQ